jgi:hypothetical protein
MEFYFMYSKSFVLTVIIASLTVAPAVFAGGGKGNQPVKSEEKGRAVQRQPQPHVQQEQQEEPRQAEAMPFFLLMPPLTEEGSESFQDFQRRQQEFGKFKSGFAIGLGYNHEFYKRRPIVDLKPEFNIDWTNK